ncbi:gro-1 operon protein 2 [Blastomyces dermatitidis ER-3]|uniref:GPN-loop GTPase n=2 Tax=Ajellomyces dermatitidis TaxID=5039 RepID=F2THB4_AJEDA|nr:gro-1 operon protein 2 [Blastomyces dermatitidis ER-3]EEQ85621.1 gro-1 operon protein 2 [Blastomyces dermatitidis ER-3]EGE82627.1 gro-1 operon protein 2 [Blastomyces dermatitidis ATCC 18188]
MAPPVAVVCVGMAGSGKTTFMQRINAHLHSKHKPPYVLNLDPAVHAVPFESNIDIRDSINYKEVMKQYNLGPNGGILTSLNLFATKVDQIISILEKRALPPPPNPNSNSGTDPSKLSQTPQKPIEHILIDTPGQIEVFVWSASGSILLETLASSFPTVIAYVIDTPRTSSTSTFMSNMLYACSILYKTKLPMILIFNKTDVKDAEFAKEWMSDFEAFQTALREEEEAGAFGGAEGGVGGMGGGSGYMGSFLNSMSLMLEEFYQHLSVVGVSAMTGDGVDEFFEAVEEKRKEFERDYKPELEKKRKEREMVKEERREIELGKLLRDMNVSGSGRHEGVGGKKQREEPGTISEAEDDEDSDEYEDVKPGEDDFVRRDDGGLEERYKHALEESAPGQSDQEQSSARYLHSSNIG